MEGFQGRAQSYSLVIACTGHAGFVLSTISVPLKPCCIHFELLRYLKGSPKYLTMLCRIGIPGMHGVLRLIPNSGVALCLFGGSKSPGSLRARAKFSPGSTAGKCPEAEFPRRPGEGIESGGHHDTEIPAGFPVFRGPFALG